MKRLKSKGLALLLAIAFLPALIQAQDTSSHRHEFSIQQTIDYANKNSVQVKNALLDVKLQEQVNREVTANAYPHINGSAGTTYNPNVATQVIPNFISPATYQVLIDQGVKDGSGNPISMPADFGLIAAQFGTKWSASAGINLSQILFDGQVFVGLQARSSTIALQQKNAEITQEQIRTNIHKVYYQLVVGRTQLELLDANIERLNKLQHDTKIMYDNGFAEKLDIDRVSVQLTNLQSEKTRVINTISNGYFGLKVLIGMPIRDELILTDSLDDQQIRDGMLDEAPFSYENRRDFQYAQIGKKLNEYNVRRYQLSQIPTVSLNANYAKNAQRNKFDFFGKGPWYTISSIGLSINVPIFNGFVTRAKIAQAKIEVQKTNNQIDALKINIDNEIETARNNFRSSISSLDFQKQNMQLAENIYQQTKKKFEEGIGSSTELNTVQVDLKAAQTNYITALYDAIIAKTDYLKATGKL